HSHLTSLSPLLISLLLNDPPTTEIYTLSLHDALPISQHAVGEHERPHRRQQHGDALLEEERRVAREQSVGTGRTARGQLCVLLRSEEHTSELQSRGHLVCRLLLEKKKNKT